MQILNNPNAGQRSMRQFRDQRALTVCIEEGSARCLTRAAFTEGAEQPLTLPAFCLRSKII